MQANKLSGRLLIGVLFLAIGLFCIDPCMAGEATNIIWEENFTQDAVWHFNSWQQDESGTLEAKKENRDGVEVIEFEIGPDDKKQDQVVISNKWCVPYLDSAGYLKVKARCDEALSESLKKNINVFVYFTDLELNNAWVSIMPMEGLTTESKIFSFYIPDHIKNGYTIENLKKIHVAINDGKNNSMGGSGKLYIDWIRIFSGKMETEEEKENRFTNLVQNPGFEILSDNAGKKWGLKAGTFPFPEKWTTISKDFRDVITIVRGNMSHSGRCAVRFEIDGQGDYKGNPYVASFSIPLEKSSFYQFSVWVKIESVNPGEMFIWFLERDKEGKVIGWLRDEKNNRVSLSNKERTHGWKEYRTVLKGEWLKGTSVNIFLKVSEKSRGVVYFDDVSIRKINKDVYVKTYNKKNSTRAEKNINKRSNMLISQDKKHIWIEGESSRDHNFTEVRAHKGAFGGKTLWLAEDNSPQKDYYAKYSIEIPEAKMYRIYVAGLSHDVTWVSKCSWALNNKDYKCITGYKYPFDRSFYDEKDWLMWTYLGCMRLQKGKNILTIRIDERRTIKDAKYVMGIDAICLSSVDSDFVPEDRVMPPGLPPPQTRAPDGKDIAVYKVKLLSHVIVGGTFRLATGLVSQKKINKEYQLYICINRDGKVLVENTKDFSLPTTLWKHGKIVKDFFDVDVPSSLIEGKAELEVGLITPGGKKVRLNTQTVSIEKPVGDALLPHVRKQDEFHHPELINFHNIEFPKKIEIGETAKCKLTFFIKEKLKKDYKIFVQLLHKDDLILTIDHTTEIPTTRWPILKDIAVGPIPVKFPEGMLPGEYQVHAGLYTTKYENGKAGNYLVADIEVESAEKTNRLRSLKPLSYGTYIDRDGVPHRWYVTRKHAMVWDGNLWLPSGGMYNSDFVAAARPLRIFQQPAEKLVEIWEKEKKLLRTLKNTSNTDIYFVDDITITPAWIWQRFLDYLDLNDFTYGIEINVLRDNFKYNYIMKPVRGYFIKAGRYQIPVYEKGIYFRPIKEERFRNITRVLYMLFDKRAVKVVKTGYAEVVRGKEGAIASANLSSIPKGDYTLYFTPEVTSPSYHFQDYWNDYEECERKILKLLSRIKLGKGFRCFLDPFANEMAGGTGVNGYHLIPNSVAFQIEYEKWLKKKYGTIDRLNKSWALESQKVPSFKVASRLIPLQAGTEATVFKGLGYLYDENKAMIYTVKIPQSMAWENIYKFRDSSIRDYVNRISNTLKRKIADVPVILKHHGATVTPNFISDQTHGGFDGIGMEAYGAHDDLIRRCGAYIYSIVEQSKQSMWCLETETQDKAGGSRERAHIGYESPFRLFSDLNYLLQIGAKGFYLFLLHGPPKEIIGYDSPCKNTFLSRDPKQFNWSQCYWELLDNKLKEVAEYKPYCYYYYPDSPVKQRNEIISGLNDFSCRKVDKLPNDIWCLPTNTIDIDTPLLITNITGPPASTKFGQDLERALKENRFDIIYLGIRKDLGTIPSLDRYFTKEFSKTGDGKTIQVLKPTPTSEVLYKTKKGKVWGLKDKGLRIISCEKYPIEKVKLPEEKSINILKDLLSVEILDLGKNIEGYSFYKEKDKKQITYVWSKKGNRKATFKVPKGDKPVLNGKIIRFIDNRTVCLELKEKEVFKIEGLDADTLFPIEEASSAIKEVENAIKKAVGGKDVALLKKQLSAAKKLFREEHYKNAYSALTSTINKWEKTNVVAILAELRDRKGIKNEWYIQCLAIVQKLIDEGKYKRAKCYLEEAKQLDSYKKLLGEKGCFIYPILYHNQIGYRMGNSILDVVIWENGARIIKFEVKGIPLMNQILLKDNLKDKGKWRNFGGYGDISPGTRNVTGVQKWDMEVIKGGPDEISLKASLNTGGLKIIRTMSIKKKSCAMKLQYKIMNMINESQKFHWRVHSSPGIGRDTAEGRGSPDKDFFVIPTTKEVYPDNYSQKDFPSLACKPRYALTDQYVGTFDPKVEAALFYRLDSKIEHLEIWYDTYPAGVRAATSNPYYVFEPYFNDLLNIGGVSEFTIYLVGLTGIKSVNEAVSKFKTLKEVAQ